MLLPWRTFLASCLLSLLCVGKIMFRKYYVYVGCIDFLDFVTPGFNSISLYLNSVIVIKSTVIIRIFSIHPLNRNYNFPIFSYIWQKQKRNSNNNHLCGQRKNIIIYQRNKGSNINSISL
jgi:hypothetical protein